MHSAVITADEQGKISITGELDFANVVSIWQQGRTLMEKSLFPVMTIDFNAVQRSNSAGLLLLISWLRDAKTFGKQITFQHVPARLLQAAKVSNLQTILPLG